ncbi:hypothetical protein [Pseudomonas sp. DWP3-1-2]|uniref:hypothetical protein n=1 Tax=Pseudomonas sp. DWP3-1-2 TaxID=2804645 RepID=UPI003CE7FDBC
MARTYAFINDEVKNYSELREAVLTSVSARKRFDRLNPHILNSVVLPGQLVIVSDHSGSLCTPEEQKLMWLASDIRDSLVSNGYTGSKVMVQNYDLLQSLMSYGSIGIGSATAAWSKHLKQVEETLKDIERLHHRWKSGVLSKDQFIAQRQLLFAKLKTQLHGIGRFGTGLKIQSNIKDMLGISSKSYLHKGEIAGYARTVKSISKTASALSKGTYVGVALDVGAGALDIQEACSVGREEQCKQAKYVEGGKMAFGIPAAAAGGTAGLVVSGAVCLALGVPSGGASLLVCGIIGGAVGGWGAGKAGSAGGESLGKHIYEYVNGDQ